MKGELWTMALHQPVDTQALDKLGREVLRKGRVWMLARRAGQNGIVVSGELERALQEWDVALAAMVLREPEEL